MLEWPHLSDRRLIYYVIRKIAIPSENKAYYAYSLAIKHFNAKKVREDLEKLFLEDTIDNDDPNDMWVHCQKNSFSLLLTNLMLLQK